MAHPFEALLTGRERKRKPIWPATIVEPVGDGTGDYKCEIDETGEVVRASVTAPGVVFAKRTSVILHRLDDGTTANGAARWLIAYENRPLNVYGVGRSHPTRGEEVNAGSAVLLLDPETLSVALGGFAGFSIHGVGLQDAVVDTNGFPTVILSEAARSDTRIDMLYSALLLGTRGQYDLTVDGITYPKFFTAT